MPPQPVLDLLQLAPGDGTGELAARVWFTLEHLGYGPLDGMDAAAAMAVGFTLMIGVAGDLLDAKLIEPMQRAAIEKLASELLASCAGLVVGREVPVGG